jgi:Zn-dependent protease
MLFGYGVDKRVIYALLIVLAVISLASMEASEWLTLLLTLPAVLIAVSFHEFAHANAADKLGDTTPRNQGRLTLNPLVHLDFFGTILMIFAHIGWGKPVQINPNNFNSNKSRSFCESMVALAGPLMNFFIAIVSCIAYVVLFEAIKPGFINTDAGLLLEAFLILLIYVDIGLGVFNLIPLPPLDGEKIFRNLLPYKIQQWLDRNYATLYMIFMILWFFGFLEIIVAPVIAFLSNGLFTVVEWIVQLFI